MNARTSIDPWFLDELRALAIDGDGTDGLVRTYKSVDTCAAEFEAETPYYYSAHERVANNRPRPDAKRGRAAVRSTGVTRHRSSSSARARTGSGRGSSSTTAASTPR